MMLANGRPLSNWVRKFLIKIDRLVEVAHCELSAHFEIIISRPLLPLAALVDAYRARTLFESSGDYVRLRQTYMFLSRIHHHLDEREARNSNAKQFRSLVDQYPSLDSPAASIYRVF